MRESFDLASDVCGAGLEPSGCHGRPHAGRDPILFTYPKTVRPEPVEGLPRFRQPFDKLRANGLYPNSIGARPALQMPDQNNGVRASGEMVAQIAFRRIPSDVGGAGQLRG